MKKIKEANRGAYLTKVLGLDNVKNTKVTTVSKVTKKVKEVDIYAQYQKRKFNYNVDDFDIDDTTYAITCKKWKGTQIQGGNSYFGSMEIIQRYVDECNKPFEERDFAWMHLA